ncbi:MAG: uroporphyrinogen-III C-methyltransferase [Burkholderiales bacterium]|nr:uroporphyrinogen-III C-methyltransferase [Burkholderiales bacterium]
MSDEAPGVPPAALPAQRVLARARAWLGGTRLALVVLFGVVLAAWWQVRGEIDALRAEVAVRLREESAREQATRSAQKETQDRLREAVGRMAALETRLAESLSQQAALESLYQDLSRNRDEWALVEIEQTLTLAAQQLQLAGNVRGALIALQNADARLGRADRAQFISIRRVLQRDMERLKALPHVDTAGLAIRLDAVIASVDQLPLVFDERLKGGQRLPEPSESAPDLRPAWKRLRDDAWEQLRDLVRIRDIGSADPTLLPPAQAYFMRENLKLKLLNARIALLQRNEALFRQDVAGANLWLGRYFDVRSRQGASAQAALTALASSAVSIELPTLADSLNAVRNFRAPARPAGRQG